MSGELRFKSYRPAEVLGYLPYIEPPDLHSIRYVAADMGITFSTSCEFQVATQFSAIRVFRRPGCRQRDQDQH